MRLTAIADYGLQTLMRLAGASDSSFTTDGLATEFHISTNNLTKVMQDRARAGYVNSIEEFCIRVSPLR